MPAVVCLRRPCTPAGATSRHSGPAEPASNPRLKHWSTPIPRPHHPKRDAARRRAVCRCACPPSSACAVRLPPHPHPTPPPSATRAACASHTDPSWPNEPLPTRPSQRRVARVRTVIALPPPGAPGARPDRRPATARGLDHGRLAAARGLDCLFILCLFLHVYMSILIYVL